MLKKQCIKVIPQIQKRLSYVLNVSALILCRTVKECVYVFAFELTLFPNTQLNKQLGSMTIGVYVFCSSYIV